LQWLGQPRAEVIPVEFETCQHPIITVSNAAEVMFVFDHDGNGDSELPDGKRQGGKCVLNECRSLEGFAQTNSAARRHDVFRTHLLRCGGHRVEQRAQPPMIFPR
jgi:hypothetical protein